MKVGVIAFREENKLAGKGSGKINFLLDISRERFKG
jgi:hypothetical protein